MKKIRKRSLFLEHIERIPNISLACEKTGISRNTIYRWQKEDEKFQELLNNALDKGYDSVNDLAESKLITKINQGDLRAITYWLQHNNKKYTRINHRDSNQIEPVLPITEIVINSLPKIE